MIISTQLRPEPDGARLAYFAKHAIEGFALGCVPMAPVWRLPPLYRSGIRFQPEPQHGLGAEDFALPNVTYSQRWGDCDDLCIYRIWELRVMGEPATCNAIWVPNTSQVHVRVRRANGSLEDPAVILGAR